MGYIQLFKSGPKHECGKDLEKEKEKMAASSRADLHQP